jgi:integrase
MYRGVRYLVSCRQLGCVHETKEASYQAANQWWLTKKIEIDGAHPNAARITEQRRRLEWAQEHAREDLVSQLADLISRLEKDLVGESNQPAPVPPHLASFCTKEGDEVYRQLSESLGRIQTQAHAAMALQRLVEEIRWQERLADSPVPPSGTPQQDRSVVFQAGLWLEDLKARVGAGQLGYGEYRNQVSYVKHFVTYMGSQTLIDAINEETWSGYHRVLLDRIALEACSPVYAMKLFQTARGFVEYLVSLKRITAPENLSDRRLRFKVPRPTIRVFTGEEITRLLKESRPVIRLMILLALNTGMTQIDVSDLSHDEIDWKSGRLTRKRSKTAHHANTPVVEYALWPETFTLLTQLRSNDPVRVLVTRSGNAWVNRREKTNDSIRMEFGKLKPALSFKYLRKTAATMLASHPEYRAYAQYFLGHAPDNVADTHYVKPDQVQFDAAVNWLREQFLS